MTNTPAVEEKPYKIIFEGANCFGAGKCAEVAANWEMDLSSGLATPKTYFLGEDALAENTRAAAVCPAKNGDGVIRIVDRRTGEEIAPNADEDGDFTLD